MPGLLDFNNPEIMQGLMLLAGKKGELPGLLGNIMQMQEQRQKNALAAQAQKQQMEMGGLQMQQTRQAMADQQAMKTLGQRAYAPNQNLVNFDDEGNAMPSSAGGGDKEFIQGLMSLSPMQGFQLRQSMQKELPYGKVDPKDYTPESLQAFAASGSRDFTLLRPRSKVEMVGGVAYDPYATKPGSVITGPQSDVISDGRGGYQFNPAKINPLDKDRVGLERTRIGQADNHFWATYGKPQMVEGGNGNFQFITPPTPSKSGTIAPQVTDTGVSSGKNQPSEVELTASGYAARMQAAGKIITELGDKGVPDSKTFLAANTPKVGPATKRAIENWVMTPDQQVYRQAQEDWVRAKLRKESGAVIADDEMQREIETYFPQLNDSEAKKHAKARSRAVAEAAMAEAAGKAKGHISGVAGARPPLESFQGTQ